MCAAYISQQFYLKKFTSGTQWCGVNGALTVTHEHGNILHPQPPREVSKGVSQVMLPHLVIT